MSDKQGLETTADWQDRVKFILDSWVKRMIAFGELKEPEKIGGFTIYECSDIIPFIEKALDQQKQEIIEMVEGKRVDTDDKDVAGSYANIYNQALNDIKEELQK